MLKCLCLLIPVRRIELVYFTPELVGKANVSEKTLWKKNEPWSQSYQTFFLRKQRIFPFFTDKLDHFS